MDNIRELIEKTAKFIEGNEKFPVPILAARARKAAQQNPTDSSVVLVSQVLTKMASNNTLFITKSEFNAVCDKFYDHGTKLYDVFAGELRKQELAGPKFMRAEKEIEINKEYSKIADPLLSNALSGMFEGKHRIYSEETAKKAHKSCRAGLFAVGMEPKKVSTFAGQDDIILCNAEYETPKGTSGILVPIEIKNDKALLPTMFLGENGFVDLSQETLVSHIKSTAGKSYKVDGQGLLNVLSTAKNGVKKIANEVEMAAIRAKAAKEARAHDTNGIIGMTLVESSVVEDPKFEQHPEHEKIGERLNKPIGMAQLTHGNALVEAGRNLVARKMAQFGFNAVNISVADVKTDSVVYAVGIGTETGLNVPVKISNKKVFDPTFFVANGSVQEFSQTGIESIIKGSSGDKRALAVASPNYGMSPESLMKEAKKAIDEENYVKAEDIINVLGETNKQAQNFVISYMMKSLTPSESEALKKSASKLDQKLPVAFNSYNIFYPKGA